MLPVRIVKTTVTTGYSKAIARSGGRIASAVVMVSALSFCRVLLALADPLVSYLFIFPFSLMP
jgi:hypothetical protein